MSKEKQMGLLFPQLIGRRIKIFTQIPNSHWATAEVTGFTGSYLLLRNVEIWNGQKIGQDRIHAQWISKIEYI